MNRMPWNPRRMEANGWAAQRYGAMGDFERLSGQSWGTFRGGASRATRNRVLGTSAFLGGVERAAAPLSKSFNLMGRNITYGRAGLTAGLGLLAVRNGANMMDRMRYGDYGGAMMSGAMTAAAGYGAYSAYMYKGAFRSHFNNVAKKMIGWAAR